MNTFYIGKALQVAWSTFKARPRIFVLMAAILTIPNLLSFAMPGASSRADQLTPALPLVILVGIVLWLIVTYFATIFALKAHDDIASVSMSSLMQWGAFVPFSLSFILYCVVVVLGMLALVVPGIILALMFMFVYLFIIDKRTRVLEAFTKSRETTKGHRWRLFGLFMAMLGISLVVNFALGFVLALLGIFVGTGSSGTGVMVHDTLLAFVGNIITVILSVSFVHAYRVLTGTKAPDATVSVAA